MVMGTDEPQVDLAQAREWLASLPGYKEVIRARISEEQRRRRELDARLLGRGMTAAQKVAMFGLMNASMREATTWQDPTDDYDYLGREVEGCG